MIMKTLSLLIVTTLVGTAVGWTAPTPHTTTTTSVAGRRVSLLPYQPYHVRGWNTQLSVGSKGIEKEEEATPEAPEEEEALVTPVLFAAESAADETDATSQAFLSIESTKDWKKPIEYSELTIGVLKETYPGENRVSQTPDSIQNLVKAGFTVVVESGGTFFCFLVLFTLAIQ